MGRPVSDTARLAAYLAIAQDLVRVWSLNKAGVERLREELRPGLRLAAGDAQLASAGALPSKSVDEACSFPSGRAVGLTSKSSLSTSEVLRGEVDS